MPSNTSPDLNDPLARLTFIWDYISSRDPIYFDSQLRTHLKPLSAHVDPTDPARAYTTFSLTVPRSLCNAANNLHGGATALIFDCATSVSVGLCAREGFWDTGHVSRTLNCSYLRPAPEGTELLVESEVVHLGKNLAALRGVIRRKDDGRVCCTCEHGKVKVEWKRQMGKL